MKTISKVKKRIQNNQTIVILLLLSLIVIEFFIIIYMGSDRAASILRRVFLDSDNEFNFGSITAIVAFLVFLFNSVYTAKKYKADLISKNRMEWIDKVRVLSADIISFLYDLKNIKNIDYEKKNTLIKKAELLKLNFNSSDDKKDDGISIKDLTETLLSTQNNQGKNYYMRKYIDKLVSESLSTQYLLNNTSINSYENAKSDCYSRLSDLEVEIYEKQYCEDADEEIDSVVGREIPEYNQYKATEIYQEMDYFDEQIRDLKNKNSKIETMFENFGKIISIYLKIEWDIAKKGE